MNTYAKVQSLITAWKSQSLSRTDLIRAIAEACLGWPYVWGAAGQKCTPSRREGLLCFHAGRFLHEPHRHAPGKRRNHPLQRGSEARQSRRPRLDALHAQYFDCTTIICDQFTPEGPSFGEALTKKTSYRPFVLELLYMFFS